MSIQDIVRNALMSNDQKKRHVMQRLKSWRSAASSVTNTPKIIRKKEKQFKLLEEWEREYGMNWPNPDNEIKLLPLQRITYTPKPEKPIPELPKETQELLQIMSELEKFDIFAESFAGKHRHVTEEEEEEENPISLLMKPKYVYKKKGPIKLKFNTDISEEDDYYY